MSQDEWLRQFTAVYGRQPSSEEFLRAREGGFGSLDADPVPGANPAALDGSAQWLADFREQSGRLPTTQEFAAAKAAGFPRGAGQSTPPTPTTPRSVGSAFNGAIQTNGATPTRTAGTPMGAPSSFPPAPPVPPAPAIPPLAAPPSGNGDKSPLYRCWWAIVAYVMVLALIVAAVCFGIPGTGIHGLVNKPEAGASGSASVAAGSAAGSDASARVASMPASVPSCPRGWTPTTWASWNGGNSLVCKAAGKSTFHVNVTAGSQSYSTDGATTSPTGGYVANFDGGASAIVAFAGSLTQLTASGVSTVNVTSQAWDNGSSSGFTAVPSGHVTACPSGSYPFSMSVWGNQWLFTCGADQSNGTSFVYSNGSTSDAGGGVLNMSGKFCGATMDAYSICQGAQVVTVSSIAHATTTTYPTQSSYLPGTGVTNAYGPQQASSDTDARTTMDAEIKQDTPLAGAYLVGQWTPQLSAKWDGVSWQGKTWSNQDIANQFRDFKQKYSTAMMLRSADWSTLGLSGHDWVTMVAGISFTNAADANRWCYAKGFDSDNCFAVQLGHGAPDQTMQKWTPGHFGD
ncbi:MULTISPECIES: hypothetical protein [Propionibacterium]|uniref:Uncharacterized protein n=2 Tax=Propionibacterium freudenreichii TaxID=1744 RepID=A0A2C8ALM5_9ACTN|nr:hypothetical protein [Propionibacterium freudenreichii]ARO11553.1 hypothetical protein BMR99_02505 [Propionibacterium freudenreichii]MCT2973239.1 hypothetical protein [Propionibacterium freudenreichii]MCT2975185.1 hypothetical protein [Propionibacterium freudenreichii]MCT2979151.1 hypothetical protein [Propionibacterium freudenreichii]MCT2985707.1 hypothetical protein [Propionibacterium freudenreichii]